MRHPLPRLAVLLGVAATVLVGCSSERADPGATPSPSSPSSPTDPAATCERVAAAVSDEYGLSVTDVSGSSCRLASQDGATSLAVSFAPGADTGAQQLRATCERWSAPVESDRCTDRSRSAGVTTVRYASLVQTTDRVVVAEARVEDRTLARLVGAELAGVERALARS